MNLIYGGLVSSPVNKKDTSIIGTATYTFGGSVIDIPAVEQIPEPEPTPTIESVDLGLPSGTLWATCNLGANSPEEAGMYFQWGDIQGYTADQIGNGAGKKAFASDFSDYKYYEDEAFTKYNSTDGKTVLDADDDAAVAVLATPWMMPTMTQFEELINSDYTTTEWVTVNGVAGRRITSKSNGNSIFLPADGYARGGSVRNAGDYGYYWSSSLLDEGENDVFNLSFSDGGVGVEDSVRCDGLLVRPVQNASV